MSEDNPFYVGYLSHPDLGPVPVVGRIVITQWSLRFESEATTVDLALSGVHFEPPDSPEDPVHFQHPEHPGCCMTASNAEILGHRVFTKLTHLRSQLEAVEARREGWRRVKVTLGFLFAFAVISVSVIWVSGQVIRHLVDRVPVAEEKKLGAKVLAEVKARRKVLDNPKALGQLNELTRRLVAAQPREEYECQIILLDDPEPNAFALPGGFVCVNRGLLKAAASPEEVAGVLAHEIAHVKRRHCLRHLISGVGPLYLLRLLFGGDDSMVGVIASGSQVLVALRFSREYEQEADDIAWEYLQAANIDPRGLASFLKRLQDAQLFGDGGGRALSSHPPTPERLEWLEAKWRDSVKKTGFVELPRLEK